ncbi:MAG: hypothetical protein K0Q59_5273 [Paenibacillus sp.]|nr:hypothetical protein [Paenibacillus sp.]
MQDEVYDGLEQEIMSEYMSDGGNQLMSALICGITVNASHFQEGGLSDANAFA